MDRVFIGVPASPGIVVGPVHLLRWEVPDVRHRVIADDAIPEEIDRLHAAFTGGQGAAAPGPRPRRAAAGPEEAAIFDAQLLVLEDDIADRARSSPTSGRTTRPKRRSTW